MVALGTATQDGNTYVLDCARLGINKLLGTGTPLFVFNITVASATSGAVEKINAKGGSVTVLGTESEN